MKFTVRLRFLSFLMIILPLMFSQPVRAQDNNGNSLFPIDELRIGSYLHDVETMTDNNTVDLNAELLLAPLVPLSGNRWVDFFFSPRPHLGSTVSFSGQTSSVYAGLTWDLPLGESFFLEASFGGAVHDGNLSQYGCRANFHETASLGINLNENWRLVGTVDHMSNGGLCGNDNRGLTNAGLRLGFKFH